MELNVIHDATTEMCYLPQPIPQIFGKCKILWANNTFGLMLSISIGIKSIFSNDDKSNLHQFQNCKKKIFKEFQIFCRHHVDHYRSEIFFFFKFKDSVSLNFLWYFFILFMLPLCKHVNNVVIVYSFLKQ